MPRKEKTRCSKFSIHFYIQNNLYNNYSFPFSSELSKFSNVRFTREGRTLRRTSSLYSRLLTSRFFSAPFIPTYKIRFDVFQFLVNVQTRSECLAEQRKSRIERLALSRGLTFLGRVAHTRYTVCETNTTSTVVKRRQIFRSCSREKRYTPCVYVIRASTTSSNRATNRLGAFATYTQLPRSIKRGS